MVRGTSSSCEESDQSKIDAGLNHDASKRATVACDLCGGSIGETAVTTRMAPTTRRCRSLLRPRTVTQTDGSCLPPPTPLSQPLLLNHHPYRRNFQHRVVLPSMPLAIMLFSLPRAPLILLDIPRYADLDVSLYTTSVPRSKVATCRSTRSSMRNSRSPRMCSAKATTPSGLVSFSPIPRQPSPH